MAAGRWVYTTSTLLRFHRRHLGERLDKLCARAILPPPPAAWAAVKRALAVEWKAAQATTVTSGRIQLIPTTWGDDVPTNDHRLRWAQAAHALPHAAARAAAVATEDSAASSLPRRRHVASRAP